MSNTLSDSRGQVFSLDATNNSNAALWLCLFDSADTSGPMLLPPIKIVAGASKKLHPYIPLRFDSGLTVAASSAAFPFTAAADDIHVEAQFTGHRP